jgi:D-beta-D-heptose 7-phosphate kinase/D-beta-D-heptose 1-phosphate adenosyltransferase
LKTRIVAQHQQVVRCDREHNGPLPVAVADRLAKEYARRLAGAAAVIFEDYAKGVLDQRRLDQLTRLARQHRLITTADPNPRHLLHYRRLTAITPNRYEAFTAAGVPASDPVEPVLQDRALRRVGQILLRKWQVENLLVTLGEQGMCLFRRGAPPHHIPTVAQEVYDVSGAGDTAIATLTLALAAGASAQEAAAIANHAAGVVVGKIGTATCSPAELRASFARQDAD